MPRSMTGFGRGESKTAKDEFKVEIRTVNHRYLDWNIRLPFAFNALESRVREFLSGRIKRGRINVNIWHSRGTADLPSISVNQPLLKAYGEAIKTVIEGSGYPLEPTLRDFVSIQDVFRVEEADRDMEEAFTTLKTALQAAVESLIAERDREGENLTKDLLGRVANLKSMMEEIKERAPRIVEDYRDRMKKRLDDLLASSETEISPERFEGEIALLAERSDITEELVRLESHLNQAEEILTQEESGASLGFLAQEILREVNTIGSKAGDLPVAQSVLAMKGEVDKIKEQAANLE